MTTYQVQQLNKKWTDIVYLPIETQVPSDTCLINLSWENRSISLADFSYSFRLHRAIKPGHIGLHVQICRQLQIALSDRLVIKFSTPESHLVADQSPIELGVKCSPSLKESVYLDQTAWLEHWLVDRSDTLLFPGHYYLFQHDERQYIVLNHTSQVTRISNSPDTDNHNEIKLTSLDSNLCLISDYDLSDFHQFSQKSLEELGVGGLQKQYHEILRRIFASRLLDIGFAQRVGLKHVKGMILYGPPGCGKTLISKQFSQLLTQVKPIVVNGPEILNKFVGESEGNIRKLFEAAKADRDPRRIHVIIFDEIDAICRTRGGAGAHSGVGDSLVNQLLTCIDGIEEMENILVIGLTNRKELLDPALLRPGRFEVHLRIGLPDLAGRRDIFDIYLKPYHQEGSLHLPSDNLEAYSLFLRELAQRTPNYSGAEIAALVKCAVSYALNREIDWEQSSSRAKSVVTALHLKKNDFDRALTEIKPQWSGFQGRFPDKFESFEIPALFEELTQQLLQSTVPQSILLVGPPRSGKTQILIRVAEQLGLEKYVLYINDNLTSALENLEIVQPEYLFFDDLLDLVHFIPLGCRYHGELVLKFKRLLKSPVSLIATTSDLRITEELGLLPYFSTVLKL